MLDQRITKLLTEYHEFGLTLLSIVKQESVDIKELLTTLNELKVQVREELELQLNNFKSEAILEVELEIKMLRSKLEK